MIRLYTALCKSKLAQLSDESIFREATDSFRHYGEKCPCCGSVGKLSSYGGYPRNLVSYKDGVITESLVNPNRYKCASCGATHALLPDILVPYSPYSLRFKLTVLLAYFERETTVEAVCKCFCIAVSTLYAWKKCLLSHKELLLGVLASRKEPIHDFLRNIYESACLSDRLQGFFNQHAFSFLQNRSIAPTPSHPP